MKGYFFNRVENILAKGELLSINMSSFSFWLPSFQNLSTVEASESISLWEMFIEKSLHEQFLLLPQ